MDHATLSGGHDLIHWVAAAALVMGGGIAIVLSAIGGRASRRPPPSTTPTTGAAREPASHTAVVLAGLSLCAGFIHLAAAPGHYAEIGDLAAGFLLAGAFQVLWARAVFVNRRQGLSRRLVRTGLAGNAAIVVVWIAARTVGLPFGHVDPVALPDGAATAFELLIVGSLVVSAMARGRTAQAGGGSRRFASMTGLGQLAVVPVLGLALLVTSLATLAIAAGADHGLPASSGEHGVRGAVSGDH